MRLGSKHNIRASILASSLCLDSASLAGGLGSKACSIKGPGSIVSEILSPQTQSAAAKVRASMEALHHSSSGVSSGPTDSSSSSSSSDAGSQGDKDEDARSTKPRPAGAGNVGGSGQGGDGKASGSLGRPPRHPKQRSASFLSKDSSKFAVKETLPDESRMYVGYMYSMSNSPSNDVSGIVKSG